MIMQSLSTVFDTCIPKMSMPKRNLTHFTYSDVICLQSYGICKNGNWTICLNLSTVTGMLYYYCVISQRLFQLSDTKFSNNLQFIHKGGFPMSPLK